jgi:hypothetical protein
MRIRKIAIDRVRVFREIGIYRSIKYILTRPIVILRSVIMKATHIYENIWVGSAEDANNFIGIKISVRGEDVDQEPDGREAISLLQMIYKGTDKEVKLLINDLVNKIDNANNKGATLVHCSAGIDRSPFAIMCWLVIKKGFNTGEAYGIIKGNRPFILEHYEWVDILRKKGIILRSIL